MSTENVDEVLAGLRSRIRAKRNERLQMDASVEVRRQKLAVLDQEITQMEQHMLDVVTQAARSRLIEPAPSVGRDASRCDPPCGKRRFASEKAVMAANKRNDKALRPYYSDGCRCWHVTKAE